MTLSELQILIGALTNDPNNDRYSLAQVNTELDNTQNQWNVEAKILKDTATLTVVAGTRQYVISTLGGVPISFPRTTHKGIPLKKRDKTYFDLYAGQGVDWTTLNGTPTDFLIEATDPAVQFITLYPNPSSQDIGANLVVEFILAHTAMAAASDTPFNASPETAPFHYGLAYDAASRLLLRDPTQQNAAKVGPFKGIADTCKGNLITVFKALEKSEPLRLRSNYVPVGRGISNWRN